ncbi:MAG: hypothetical protein GTN81_11190 [Proteobacteria bacterium]|nr:hypothetical protein [Pseudomonadota bacterium]
MEEVIPLDTAFHLLIGRTSRNSLFLAIMEAINAGFLARVFFIPQGGQEEDDTDLADILEAPSRPEMPKGRGEF